MKKVYVGMIADLIHAGHIRVLEEASRHGEVTVGLFTAKAGGEVNDVPFLSYEQRALALNSIKFVSEVIPQETASYVGNLKKLKPDIVIHGDDWKYTWQSKFREEVLETLKEWNGELIEVPYSKEINESSVKNKIDNLGVSSAQRLDRFRKLIHAKPIIRILEVHNALSGLIAENVFRQTENGPRIEFDGMWSSSLTDSTSKGKPDIEAVDLTSRLFTVNEIFEVTTKPMIFDADTGGKIEHFALTVKSLERTGVGAVVIEDKTGLKKNSLFGNEVPQTQDSIEGFCSKIQAGKNAQLSNSFMIISRIESLILEAGMDDALKRAHAYIEAGTDGIMIHSRNKKPDEIAEFMRIFRSSDKTTPVVVVPTSFNSVTVDEFIDMKVNAVIYANHMLRAAYPGMFKVAEAILEHGRSLEAEKDCMSVSEILNLIPGTK